MQNSRLMHQFYYNEVNAPVELKKSIRLMKKNKVDMKELKKSFSAQLIDHNQKKSSLQISAEMSK